MTVRIRTGIGCFVMSPLQDLIQPADDGLILRGAAEKNTKLAVDGGHGAILTCNMQHSNLHP